MILCTYLLYLVIIVLVIMQILLNRKMKLTIEFAYQNHVVLLNIYHLLKMYFDNNYIAHIYMTYSEAKGDKHGK